MSTKTWRWLVFLPWIFIIPWVIRFLMVWDQLLSPLVVHFDIPGEPNGWMGRGIFLALTVMLLLIEMSIFSWILIRIGDRPASWFVLVIFYLFTAGEISLFWQILEYNLHKTPIRWVWVGVVVLIAGFVLVMAILIVVRTMGFPTSFGRSRRISSDTKALSEEIHRSKSRFWINLPFCLIAIMVWILCPMVICRAIAVVAGMVAAYFVVLMWSGFRYRFTKEGIEIAGLWRSFMFIPIYEIESYGVRTCNPLRDFGGWGIRTCGDSKAFIWSGRHVVWIKTRTSEIFLGHEDPEKIISHLDAMMKDLR